MTALPGRVKPTSDRPDPAERRAAEAHVHAVVRASGTSFYWGMRMLPPARRRAMYAVYAFCREVDDIADSDLPVADRQAGLARWRAELEALFDGRPGRPTSLALVEPIDRFALPKAEFEAMLEGMEMDADGRMRAPPMAVLERYCRCVAGAVGMLSVRIFGATGATIDRGAVALGEALQLTNILRDLVEDGAFGRLYLPEEWLERHGIASRDPASVLADPAVARVCTDLAGRAEQRFAEAEAAFAPAPRRQIRPALVMMAIYRRTLEGLQRRGWQDLGQTVRLSKAERLWLALRHGLL